MRAANENIIPILSSSSISCYCSSSTFYPSSLDYMVGGITSNFSSHTLWRHSSVASSVTGTEKGAPRTARQSSAMLLAIIIMPVLLLLPRMKAIIYSDIHCCDIRNPVAGTLLLTLLLLYHMFALPLSVWSSLDGLESVSLNTQGYQYNLSSLSHIPFHHTICTIPPQWASSLLRWWW